jgi:competence protein ComEC
VKNRLAVLFWLWFVSFVIGFVFFVFMGYRGEIVVAGKVDKAYLFDNKCIIEVGNIFAKIDGSCAKYSNKNVGLFGTTRPGLINSLMGKIELTSATIDVVDSDVVLVSKSPSLKVYLERFANYCTRVYKEYLPYHESALLSGIVFGLKKDIGYDFYQQMVKSGSIHIAVASGFNLMLLGGFVMYPLFYIWRRKGATIVAIVFLFLYALVTGFEPPMIRAWLMISFLFLGLAFGRKQEGWWALLVSVWVVLIWDIRMLWSVSFQLSVAASVGLIVLVPVAVRLASERGYEQEAKFLEKIGFLGTFMAMLLTTPIIWYHFGKVSFIGLFSNLLILPLVPPVMVLGLLMLVLPSVFYLPTYALLHMIVVLIEFFGS